MKIKYKDCSHLRIKRNYLVDKIKVRDGLSYIDKVDVCEYCNYVLGVEL